MKIKIELKQDLKDVKIADKKKQILNILHKWLIQIREKNKEFKQDFIYNKKHDKYFNSLKDIIGDFKSIPKMEVIQFLAEVIIVDKSKYKICRELHKEYVKTREKVRKEYGEI